VPKDAIIEAFELHDIPPFNQDEERNPPERVALLKSKARAADAILFVTPEYNYSVPGVLKNAIDWASRPYGDNAWNEKPVAVMGGSVGAFGSARAQYHLRQMFVFLNMHALAEPGVMVASAAQRFDETLLYPAIDAAIRNARRSSRLCPLKGNSSGSDARPGPQNVPPSRSVSIARIRSRAARDFRTQPRAPAFRTALTRLFDSCIVKISTRVVG
jgi:NAD(P)H-dependent FMN reductase